MLTIIHGDDQIGSRKKLTELKSKLENYDVFQFDGEKATTTDIIQVFESQSLFGNKKLIVLERFIGTKDKTLVASVLNHLKKDKDREVIFWEPAEIKRELLSLFPKEASIVFFKQEQLIFQFLDAIRPGNTKSMLLLFHQVLKNEAEDRIFYMLVRQFRLLLGLSVGSRISEVARLAPWQKQKLLSQARFFSQEQLKKFYSQLFEIEKKIKTGGSALPLAASLDLFLASI